MELMDALAQKGCPVEIPDCSREALPAFFGALGFKVGAEVGVYKGQFSELFLRAGLKMYGIDPWQEYPEWIKGVDIETANRRQDRQDYLYARTQRRLREYIASGRCVLIRKTSMEAVADFSDESLDFVYIDGNHRFRYIAEDLAEWTFKVRKGGIVSGHDFCLNAKEARDPFVCHVPRVLDAWMRVLRVPAWYLIGRAEKIDGEQRDPFRSWFWVRQ